jgi:hypothetical protein
VLVVVYDHDPVGANDRCAGLAGTPAQVLIFSADRKTFIESAQLLE